MPKKAQTPFDRMKNSTLTEWKRFPCQGYPDDINHYFNKREKIIPLIDKTTPVASMGSCFAGYIARYLNKHGYKYIRTERTPEDLFSARWGSVLSPPCIKQVFQYSLDKFEPIVPHWKIKSTETKRVLWQDPFRSGILHSPQDYNEKIKIHRENSKIAITTAKVFILTLGMVEVWRDKRDLSTFSRVPPLHLYDENIHEFHVLSETECFDDLHETYLLLKKHNPKCHLIISVSPIPLYATFRDDIDVVSASNNSKSVLRSSADRLIRLYEDIHYFPSFEYVIYGFHGTGGPWLENSPRHVKRSVVSTMMEFFLKLFSK